MKISGVRDPLNTTILKSPLLIGDGSGETFDNFKDIHVLKNQDGVKIDGLTEKENKITRQLKAARAAI